MVVQGSLNNIIGQSLSLNRAILLNASVFIALSLSAYIFYKWAPDSILQYFPEFLRLKNSETETIPFKLWYLIPGICGFTLVMGLPLSIQNIGPAKTFVVLISSQIIFSLGSDYWVFHKTPSLTKLAGALLTLAGAVLSILA